MMLPSQVKMFLPMGIMWGYNKFGQELPANALRIAYAASQVFALLSALYIWSRAEATASTTETITTKTKQPTGPEKVEKLSVKEYDIKEVKASIGKLLTGAALVVGLHSWKGFLQPLVIQAIMGILLAIDDPLFRIYVLGSPPVGPLKRPFKKDASPFAAMLGQTEDKPAEAAEGVEGEAAEADGPVEAIEGSADGNGHRATKRDLKKIR